MEIQLQKVPRRMKLPRKVKVLNNSVIYKNVELKFSMNTYSGPLITEIILSYNLTSSWRHGDVFYFSSLFADQNINMMSF